MTEPKPTSPDLKLGQGRSPAYPYIPLEKALDRVAQVYAAGVGDKAYPPETFYKIWDIGAKSSSARQIMAALNHFDLVDYDGRGDVRKVRLTDLALKIVRDRRPESAERESAIKVAALTPPIHKKLYEQFPFPMPSDVFVEHFLVDVAGYNESAAKTVLKEYLDTISFAKLNKPGSMPKPGDKPVTGHEEGLEAPGIKVGDLVQWASGGVDQFEAPAKVLGLSDDGEWVFTDQSPTGLQIAEVRVMEKAAEAIRTPPAPSAEILAAMVAAQKAKGADTRGLAEGESVLTSGKLRSGAFEVRVTGATTARDVGRIILLLQAQQKILADEEGDEDLGS